MTLVSHPAPPYSCYSSPPKLLTWEPQHQTGDSEMVLPPWPGMLSISWKEWPGLSSLITIQFLNPRGQNPSIPEAKRDFSFIGQREALCEHSLPGLASTPLNLMKRHYLSPFCGTPSIGCLSTTDPLQNPSIFPANFPHQYKQESTTQTATPSSPFPIFSLIFIPNSSQDLVVLSVCMAYPALPSPTPLQYGLSPKRCALHRLYFAIQHKVLISYLT